MYIYFTAAVWEVKPMEVLIVLQWKTNKFLSMTLQCGAAVTESNIEQNHTHQHKPALSLRRYTSKQTRNVQNDLWLHLLVLLSSILLCAIIWNTWHRRYHHIFFHAVLPEAQQPPHRSYFPTEFEFLSLWSDKHSHGFTTRSRGNPRSLIKHIPDSSRCWLPWHAFPRWTPYL